jgi:hypothetical protein
MGTVRVVHDFGGPEKEVQVEQRGSVLLILWTGFSGWYHVDQKTGYVKSKKTGKTRWRIHPDDFKYFKQDDKHKKRRF